MSAKKHGKNGRIYIGGSQLTYANTWRIRTDTTTAESQEFGATQVDRAIGIMSWGGTLSAYHDQDAKVLYTAATAGASYLLAIYPDYNDTSTYWSGYAFFSTWESTGNVTDFIAETADFVGASTLTATGFS